MVQNLALDAKAYEWFSHDWGQPAHSFFKLTAIYFSQLTTTIPHILVSTDYNLFRLSEYCSKKTIRPEDSLSCDLLTCFLCLGLHFALQYNIQIAIEKKNTPLPSSQQ